MKKLLTPIFLAGLVAMIAAACSNTSRLIVTGLEIELTGIERAADGTVSVAWQVKNPNVVSYLFSKVSHKIQLNGISVGSIEDNEPLAVPASNSAARTSKLTGLSAAASHTLDEAVTAGSARYRLDSQITILIYDDTIERSALSNSGTVGVKSK